jgi:hypothetical protein
MKLTIIRLDNAVYKDGVCFTGINLNSVPTNIHALQWETDAGWIEYENEAEFKKQPNLVITALPDWATEAVSAWEAAKQQAEQDAIEARAAVQALKAAIK